MNTLLERQLGKFLSEKYRKDKNLQEFFNAVNRSYENYEGQLSMSQRAMMISSDELYSANIKLREETTNLKKIINSLNYVVKVLNIESFENVDDIKESVNLVKYIEKQSNEIISANLAREDLLKNLEDKNQELNNYAHIVSHDLKSPLRGIDSLVNWIIEEKGNSLTEESQYHFKLILDNLEKMESLINGILNYSTIDKVQMSNYEIDTFDIVKQVIGMISIPDTIKIVFDKNLPIVKGDKFRIQQLFQNLIQNAINSYNKEGGEIQIGVVDNGDFWKFHVKDYGKGIEAKFFEKIFEMFESFNQERDASGIGLSIVKKIVKFYKGEIWLESEVSKGTTFYFTLPKNKL